ncbi:MAG: DUF3857 domain-containing protein [Candidatus Eisenbacteria bacterium]
MSDLSRRPQIDIVLAVVALLLLQTPPHAWAGEQPWLPVSPTSLAAGKPVVDARADAEVLFHRVRVVEQYAQGYFGSNIAHYVRTQVFTDRGRDQESRVEIPIRKGTEIGGIRARSVRKDGGVTELQSSQVIEKEIVKASGRALRVMTFVIPGAETGGVLEYQWAEQRGGRSGSGYRIPVQAKVPSREFEITIVPPSIRGLSIKPQIDAFNMEPFLLRNADGTYTLRASSLPALDEEVYAPPDASVGIEAYLSYQVRVEGEPEDLEQRSPRRFYTAMGAALYKDLKHPKANGAVRKAAAEIIKGKQSQDEALLALERYCRTQVRLGTPSSPGLTAKEIAWLSAPHSPSDVLERGMGSGGDIDMLFLAFAEALGYETSIGLRCDLRELEFDPDDRRITFLDDACVAVKLLGTWRLYAPSERDLPAGVHPWWFEGQTALIPVKNGAAFADHAPARAEQSVVLRRGRLRLTADGTLEGDVATTYTGHLAHPVRKRYKNLTTTEQTIEAGREQTSLHHGAAVSDVVVEVGQGGSGPTLASAYHIRVPGYAKVTGDRLLLRPSYFAAGRDPLFRSQDRRYPVWFPYRWSEFDSVTIALPEGMFVEGGNIAPPALPSRTYGQQSVTLTQSADRRVVELTRSFTFGNEEGLRFAADGYADLKRSFDAFQRQDDFTISLLREGTEAAR